MGDFKRHSFVISLPDPILKGIQNHRFVDKCTDQTPEVKQLRQVFSPQRRRFAGVVSDIAFDYFLIKHWSKFEDTLFDDFVDESYAGLLKSIHYMPDQMQRVVKLMCDHDWLRTYSTLEGLDLTINQVAKRIRFKNTMTGAIDEVTANYEAFERVFLILFPQLRHQVTEASIER